MSGESQVKDCPSSSSGRAWASRKGSPRAPGEFLGFPLPTCPPTPPNTSISQLPTPIHPQNYKALPALKCSRAQLWDKELGSSPGLPLLLWRTLAWPPASLILTVFLGSSLEFGLVDAPPQTGYASGTGWLGQQVFSDLQGELGVQGLPGVQVRLLWASRRAGGWEGAALG